MNLTGLLQRSVWTHSVCQNFSKYFSDMFVSSLLPVLKLQVWRDDREVRLLWQRALDRHNEEGLPFCTHIWIGMNVEARHWCEQRCTMHLVRHSCASPDFMHFGNCPALFSGDTARFWNESGGHRVSRASAGAPSTLVALQFFGLLRRLTSHCIESLQSAASRHFWVQERPIADH